MSSLGKNAHQPVESRKLAMFENELFLMSKARSYHLEGFGNEVCFIMKDKC